jgi:hypothetical protein
MCAPSEGVIWKQITTKLFKFQILCLMYCDGNKKSEHISVAHIDLSTEPENPFPAMLDDVTFYSIV